jgi:hypothetical protein
MEPAPERAGLACEVVGVNFSIFPYCVVAFNFLGEWTPMRLSE